MNQTSAAASNHFFYFTPSKAVTLSEQSELHTPHTTVLHRANKPLDISCSQSKHPCRVEEEDDDTITCAEGMTQKLFRMTSSAEINQQKIITEVTCQKTLFADEEEELVHNHIDVVSEVSCEKTRGFHNSYSLRHRSNSSNKHIEEDFKQQSQSSSTAVATTASYLLPTQKLIKSISKQTKKPAASITSLARLCSSSVTSFGDSPRFSAASQKLISSIQSSFSSAHRTTLSPSRNGKVNAILNKPSLKERYTTLLGSKILPIADKTNEEMIQLFTCLEEVMFKHVTALLSQLIQAIPGLTVQKMNAIMNVSPHLYALSLHRGGNSSGGGAAAATDMLVVLPLSENAFDLVELKEKRLAGFKQILYFNEKAKEEQTKSAAPALSVSNQLLTTTIKESLESKKTQLFDAFRSLFASDEVSQEQSARETASIQLRDVAESMLEYFNSRNVSNIFKLNIVQHLTKSLAIDLTAAEQKLQELILAFPSWLTEVHSSLLGSIVRVNYAFDVKNVA